MYQPVPWESVLLGSTHLPFRLLNVEEPQKQANNTRQGSAVPAAGTEWKLFDFWGII